MSLFRDEAVAAQATPYLGNIRIGRNPGFMAISLFTAVAIVGLGGFATTASVARKATLSGVLVPAGGEIKVLAPQSGVVTLISAQEGTTTSPGGTLMELTSDRGTAQGQTEVLVEQNIDHRRSSLLDQRQISKRQADQRRQSLDNRIAAMQTEQSLQARQSVALQQRLKISQSTVDSYRKLVKDGFMSPVQEQQQEDQLLDLTSRLAESERSLTALTREREELKAQLDEVSSDLDATLAQSDRDLSALDRETVENKSRGEALIKAPAAGEVSVVNVHLGQQVEAGQVLATLLPEQGAKDAHRMSVRLFAPSRSAGFLQSGETVWIRYAAFPYEKFGFGRGRVAAISKTPVSATELPAAQQGALGNEPMYRVDVELDTPAAAPSENPVQLKSGMALTAEVELERRSILEFLLEPFIGARRQIAPV